MRSLGLTKKKEFGLQTVCKLKSTISAFPGVPVCGPPLGFRCASPHNPMPLLLKRNPLSLTINYKIKIIYIYNSIYIYLFIFISVCLSVSYGFCFSGEPWLIRSFFFFWLLLLVREPDTEWCSPLPSHFLTGISFLIRSRDRLITVKNDFGMKYAESGACSV